MSRWCSKFLWIVILFFVKYQHFTTFTPPRKLTKLVYTRPELSPLDFLWFGPYRPKCKKIFHAVFASLYGFAAPADWRFGTLQNARPDTVAFSGFCERGLPDSPYVHALLAANPVGIQRPEGLLLIVVGFDGPTQLVQLQRIIVHALCSICPRTGTGKVCS